MAVVECTEVSARSYSETPTGERTYTRTFEIRTDNPLDGPVIVRAASCLPARGAAYNTGHSGESDSAAKCIGITSLSPINDDPYLWIAVASYSTEYPKNPTTCNYLDDDVTSVNRVIVEREYRIWEKFATEDLNSKSFVNTAGDPLLNPPPTFVTNTIFRITKPFAAGDWGDSDTLAITDSINSVAWLDFPQYSIKCHTAKWEKMCERGTQFVLVTFELEYNPELWYPTLVLSTGFRAIDSVSGEPKTVTDEFGNATPNAVLLAVDGSETDTPYEIDFKMIRFVDIGTMIGLLPAGSIGSLS